MNIPRPMRLRGRMLTEAEAAQYLGVSVDTLRDWRGFAEGPKAHGYMDMTCKPKPQQRWQYDPEELMAWAKHWKVANHPDKYLEGPHTFTIRLTVNCHLYRRILEMAKEEAPKRWKAGNYGKLRFCRDVLAAVARADDEDRAHRTGNPGGAVEPGGTFER